MVISKMKRKRREECLSPLLDDSPKRTKVHAQRKFAQGSNVNSPVITPVKEIERQEIDVLPEPVELLPMKRPNTEDFLTFLCFRGTPVLPPSLNFFNTASIVDTNGQVHEIKSESPKNGPIDTSSISKTASGSADRPFIAFGVRKRADPIVISKQMDKKRRHALALQALRRKYQEQRMAKIRAVTISKLSEKVTSKTLLRSNSVSKNEPAKKPIQKPKVEEKKEDKVMATRSMKACSKQQINQQMCLRSFRGRFVQKELQFRNVKKLPLPVKKIVRKVAKNDAEYSSEDDKPLVKTSDPEKPKVAKKSAPGPKKPAEITFRITRSKKFIQLNNKLVRRQQIKQRMMITSPKTTVKPRTLRSHTQSNAIEPRQILRRNTRTFDKAKKETVPKKADNVRKVVKKDTSPKKTEKKDSSPPKKAIKSEPTKKKIDVKAEVLTKKKPTVILRKNKVVESITKDTKVEKAKKEDPETKSKLDDGVETQKRPTRKTKEAAAIYMEILSHKLVNESKIDDDNVSIDSFPELPNIKKTEQTENELKAKAKCTKSESEEKKDIFDKVLRSKKVEKEESCDKVESEVTVRINPMEAEKERKGKSDETTRRQTRNSSQVKHTETDDSDESFHADVKIPRKKQVTRSKVPKVESGSESVKKSLRSHTRSYKEFSSSESDYSTTSDVNVQVIHLNKNKKFTKTRQTKVDSFSDSDEEPLSKLTNKKEEPKKEPEKETKPKRECAKRPQNYLAMLSSSEEDDYFQSFSVKTETKPKAAKAEVCTHPQTSDLSYKDIGRRFGKGKVNMSTEQIEKWLKDSAMAGNSDATFQFGEKIPTETSHSVAGFIDTDRLKRLLINAEKVEEKKETVKNEQKVTDRKLIFKNKDKMGAVTKVKAFSASDENSVYAFEEAEDVLKTPFRRPTRRPSSTATSKSEDETSRYEDVKTLFRRPPLMKQDSSKSKESITPDESLEEKDITFNKPKGASKKPSMTPPSLKQPSKLHRISDSEDCKYKVPSSPSASSSSSAKLYKRQTKRSIDPVKLPDFPNVGNCAQLVEAPTFYPTEKEFQDPLEYIEKIRAKAEQFGICKIVPPSTFKPECKVTDDMRFTAYNQYVHKLLYRWGPNFKELMAIKKYLSTQNISLTHSPWIGGMEIDLPRLYQTVQSLGGLKEVIEKKKWPKVSEAMKIPKSAQDRVTKLDDIYCKYLLPYDTLSPVEREKLFDEVETDWAKRESKSLLKAQQNIDDSETEESDSNDEAEECIVKGRNIALNAFYRIARNTMSMWFKTTEPPVEEVEQEFWKHVTQRQNHICVHSGSIDSGNWGYGFAVSKNSPFARHAWNLKVLTNNSGSVLRSIGPVMGVTVPTLHVGMVFSSCCWYRDPHSLPWIEYLHTGGSKIWYGVPDSASGTFRTAVKSLVPNYCRNKSLWLPSDTVMVPPNLLVDNGVSLSRIVQQPGQFIVVFPKAFTSSLSTGYVVSESVYFAPPYWLKAGRSVFDEMRDSCEPSMFSFDRLLLSIVDDSRSNVEVLRQIIPAIRELCDKEKASRERIKKLGVLTSEKLPLPEAPQVRKKKKLLNEDGEYECEVCRMNLFVSMVIESQEDAVYCLEHAAQQLEKKKIQSKHCKLSFTYDAKELDGLIDKINLMIANKLQKKVTSKFTGLPTLLT